MVPGPWGWDDGSKEHEWERLLSLIHQKVPLSASHPNIES